MLKNFVIAILLLLCVVGEPAFALSPTPNNGDSSYQPWTYFNFSKTKVDYSSGVRNPDKYPRYLKQIDLITENFCDAVAVDLYRGNVYYTCQDGASFWADVLVPSEYSPLFMYFKNRKKHADEVASEQA